MWNRKNFTYHKGYARFATMSRFTGNTKHALLAEKRGDKHVLIGIGHNRKRKEQKKDTKAESQMEYALFVGKGNLKKIEPCAIYVQRKTAQEEINLEYMNTEKKTDCVYGVKVQWLKENSTAKNVSKRRENLLNTPEDAGTWKIIHGREITVLYLKQIGVMKNEID